MNHQSKLKKVNKEEEMKALAMISSLENQMLSNKQSSYHSQSVIQPH